jgi:tetratricopeptide (TPR) repeat protein
MTLLNTPGSSGPRPGLRSFAAVILAFSLVTVGIVPSQARAAKSKAHKEATDPREMQAREAYAAGSYKEALDIYTRLYAEKLHPTYLRNIGRCYQNLGEPDRAISSFREYLRKAKNLPADERAEVEGYIGEMEELQKKNAAAAAPTRPLPQAAPPVEPSPPPSLVQPRPMATAEQSAPANAESPFYKRAWFWALVGGVVVAGTVGGLWAGGAFSAKSNNGCPNGTLCVGP